MSPFHGTIRDASLEVLWCVISSYTLLQCCTKWERKVRGNVANDGASSGQIREGEGEGEGEEGKLNNRQGQRKDGGNSKGAVKSKSKEERD